MRTKEYRRRKEFLRKKKAEKFVKIIGGAFNYDKLVRMYTEDRCPCSCPMCGNQRKHWGQTLQEDLADINFKEQINGN